MKKIVILSGILFMANVAIAQPKIQKVDKGAFIEITQDGGSTLGYNQNSGIKILEVEGFAFKDLNRNGKLDKYEDWRLSSEERAKDLASKLSLDEIAGLMLYSSHQDIPGNYTDVDPAKHGYYNGLSFPETRGIAPSASTDQQIKYVEENVRHFLVRAIN
ncbi:MAG: beta-glucosidase, partial [Alistipes sp.]|nr:beta-glucosidase [Alistipes sp.]